MNNHTKWEAVEPVALRHGDEVRATHATNGSVIVGRVRNGEGTESAYVAPANIKNHLENDLHLSIADGWSFERPVPERTLPTEPGWYEFIRPPVATTHIAYVYEDKSIYFPEGPDVVDETDLAAAFARGNVWRMVRVTDVEELRQRIEKIRERIARLGGSYIGTLALDILAIVDGEV